jgi:hypothetical protein
MLILFYFITFLLTMFLATIQLTTTDDKASAASQLHYDEAKDVMARRWKELKTGPK